MSRYTLVIVESPNKCQKIGGYLGSEYRVRASFGHIRDLPKDGGLAVRFDAGRVQPQYIVTAEQRTLSALRAEAAGADRVILASDPDREGEGIAWHLREVLGRHLRYERVVFHAITKEEIGKAIAAPREIDQHLVDAQQARRVLDRVVGWLVSPTCRKGTGDAAAKSAGRVQSVALRIVVERELEIRDFQPKDYFVLQASLEKPGSPPGFTARLVKWRDKDLAKGFAEIADAEALVVACRGGRWNVGSVIVAPSRRNAPPPFTTATVQQACSVQLGLRPEQTTTMLQGLFEDGLITYPRTDAVALAPEAIAMAREYIDTAFGAAFVPASPNTFASRSANTQEAHEAIRPTSVDGGPALAGDEVRGQVYRLIWTRFIACQMAHALDEVTTVDVTAAGGQAVFRARGVTVTFDGWRRLTDDATDEGAAARKRRQRGEEADDDVAGDEDAGIILPKLVTGDSLRVVSVKPAKRTTKPSPRFTQASLIKKLDHDGIGRPSTYASIMRTLLDRGYVLDKRRKLEATDTGIKLVRFLKQAYAGNVIEYQYTANMEEQLDRIARGECAWEPLIHTASHQVLELARAAGLDHNPLAGEQPSRSLPERLEIPRGTREACCRTCAKAIYWISHEGRNVACNADGAPHARTCTGASKTGRSGGRRRSRAVPASGSTEAKPTTTRPCRDCQSLIGFVTVNGRLTVQNPDGTPHRCSRGRLAS